MTLEADVTFLFHSASWTREMKALIPFPLDLAERNRGRTLSGFLLIDPVEADSKDRLLFSLTAKVSIAGVKGFLPGLVGANSLSMYRLMKMRPGTESRIVPIHTRPTGFEIQEPKHLSVRAKILPLALKIRSQYALSLLSVRGKTVYITDIAVSGRIEPAFLWCNASQDWKVQGIPFGGLKAKSAQVTISRPREFIWGQGTR